MGRKESEEKLIKALEDILIQGEEPGINLVAQRAGLNKVLIYRYFGGLEGLMSQFSQRMNLWKDVNKEIERDLVEGKWNSIQEVGIAAMKAYRRKLRDNPLYLTILRKELSGHNPLTRALEADRETQGLKSMELIHRYFPRETEGKDVPAISNLIVSAITYLMLKAQDTSVFGGIDITTDQGWERFEELYFHLFSL